MRVTDGNLSKLLLLVVAPLKEFVQEAVVRRMDEGHLVQSFSVQCVYSHSQMLMFDTFVLKDVDSSPRCVFRCSVQRYEDVHISVETYFVIITIINHVHCNNWT